MVKFIRGGGVYMDLSNVSKVIEFNQINKVNLYLSLGWQLIFVGQYSSENYSYICYSLGWLKSQGMPIEPNEEGCKKYGNYI